MKSALVSKSFHASQAVIASAIVLIVGSLPFAAVAADVQSENANTGPYSSNQTTVTDITNNTTDIRNSATSVNSFSITASTGDNSITGNTKVGDISTGDVSYDVSEVTRANSADTSATLPSTAPSPASVIASNHDTGPGSTNSTNITNSTTRTTNITNSASVTNSAIVNTHTGGNNISHNTLVGAVTTGAINGSVAFTNDLNVMSSGPVVPPTPPSDGGGTVTPIPSSGTVTPGSGGGSPPSVTTSEGVPPVALATPEPSLTPGMGAGMLAPSSEFFPSGANTSLVLLEIFLPILLAAAVIFDPRTESVFAYMRSTGFTYGYGKAGAICRAS